MPVKRRIVFGGTFDPVHRGHLESANAVYRALSPDEFRFLPAGDPPHRSITHASPEHRLRMLQLALKPYPWFTIDQQELEREGPSWMTDTLQALRKAFPQDALILLLGQDSANGLATWHQWRRIPELAHLVIMTRPGESPEYTKELALEIEQRIVQDAARLAGDKAGLVLPLSVPPEVVSSTDLRERIAMGQALRDLVPVRVAEYIELNGLYRDQGLLSP